VSGEVGVCSLVVSRVCMCVLQGQCAEMLCDVVLSLFCYRYTAVCVRCCYGDTVDAGSAWMGTWMRKGRCCGTLGLQWLFSGVGCGGLGRCETGWCLDAVKGNFG
jgi:hypothetical protein